MAVAIRSQGSVTTVNTSVTSLTVAMPASIQSGDFLVAFIHNQSSTAPTDATAAGWSRVGAPFIANDTSTRTTGFFTRIATSSEPTSYTFTFSSAAAARSVGVIMCFSGVDTTNPVVASSAWSATSVAGTTLPVAAMPASAGFYTLEIASSNFSSPNSYALTSYTGTLTSLQDGYVPNGTENTGVSRSALHVWGGIAPTGGVPAHSIQSAGSSTQSAAALISLNPSGGGSVVPTVTPTQTGYTTPISSGTGSTVAVNPAINQMGTPIADGNWMILVVTSDNDGTNTANPIPTGWTQLRAFTQVGSGTMAVGVWAKLRVSGETSYGFSLNPGSNSSRIRLIWGTGAQDPTSWIIGTFANRSNNATSTTTLAPSITTTVAHTLALLLSFERTIATETDAQITTSNFAKRFTELTVDVSETVALKDMISPGVTGTATTTYPNPHPENGLACIVGITPVQTGNVSSNGLSLKVSNGTSLVSANFKIADGNGGLIAPGAYKVVRPGYSSVTQMLAQPFFYCAHRGGSSDYPEMSLYAYGQSALVGYPALEISLARSSDGVWFGLHDASLDRTSLGSGGGSGTSLIAASMTWSQIQAYSILGTVATNNPAQSNRPYMRWEELIATYYSSHVLFVDPKVAISYRAELLNKMDALPNSTAKFVGKYYGVSGGVTEISGWNFDCHARGYKTWGYFYQSDAANIATYAPRWDILGMDYSADQATWTSILSYGKPVMGHICPNTAAINTARTYGAKGVMVSGVLGNVPPAISL